MKILDGMMWISIAVSFVISILTMLVTFGIKWIPPFATFMPVEISLAVTFFLWGVNSIYNHYTKDSRITVLYSFLFGGVLLIFVVFGIY